MLTGYYQKKNKASKRGSQKQGFGREKDGNRRKFISSNQVIFRYKEFEKFALCKSVSQSEATFIVYSEPIESGHVKFSFS